MAKILVVEDDPLLVRLYEKAFQIAGYEVETAFNGGDGFTKAQAGKPTLILSDIMMPKVNGIQMIEKLKATEDLKNIPVVLLTNLGSDKDAEQGLSLGAVTYLVKSQYEPKEVVRKVQEIIAGYSRGKDAIPEVKVSVKETEGDG